MDNQNPSNQIPPVEPQGQGVPPTGGIKISTSTGIAIIAIAVLAAGAYFFFSNRTTAPKVEDSNQTQDQEQTVENQVAGWQTYTNTKYGFEAKIPADWTVEESASNELVFFSQASRDANAARTLRCKDAKVKAEEALECSRRNQDMYFVNENYGNGTTKKEIINGVEWEVLEGENSGWQYQTKQGGKLYHFKLPYLPENKAKLSQFLSTFKFTTQAETADWKTYNNTKFGFTFKYPTDWLMEGANDYGAFVHPKENYLNHLGEGRILAGMRFSAQTEKDFFTNNDVYKKGANSLSEYVSAYRKVNDAYGLSPSKNISLNGYDAVMVTTGGMDSGTDILLAYNGNIYRISLSATADMNIASFGLKETESKLLSTFKFTN